MTRADSYDEMVTGGGEVRPQWRRFLSALSALPEGGLAERAERARLLLQDDGVSFSDGKDPAGAWPFDSVPLILSAEEWATLEAGIAQRARLMEAILADLYGPMRLIEDGLVPAGLVLGNPDFLRAARRLDLAPPSPQLFTYGVDLIRCEDGIFRVLADRCQTPVGAGYALENRRVLARTLPELFAACPVRPLTGWFEHWADGLKRLAPDGAANPRIALLTPGPAAETYFEHVYLARELGLTLVEGGDLTCRGGRLYLKSLGGLQPVDVVMRRIDGDFVDPLLLREDSLLGVAGLLPAVMRGTVSLANAAGAGVMDSPAWHGLLPDLCRRLLGEEPLLEALPSRWGGSAGTVEAVLADPAAWQLRPAFDRASATASPVDGDTLARFTADPAAWIALPPPVPACAPCLADGRLEPAGFVIRCFAAQSAGGIAVMPGGLARLPGVADAATLRLPGGAVTKDVWVMAGEEGERSTPLPSGLPPVAIIRTRGELSSRMAENLFWLGRYIERLDNHCRLLRAALLRLGQGSLGPRAMTDLSILAGIMANTGLMPRDVAAMPPDSRAFHAAVTGAGAPDKALAGTFRMIGRAALSLRERIAADLWQATSLLLNDGQRRLADSAGSIDGTLAALDRVIRMAAAVAGMASEGMTRGTGWRFLDLGRRIERGLYTAGGIRIALSVPAAGMDGALRLMLELCDSAITYRYRYLSALQAAPVLDLVIGDETNPRSLAYQLDTAALHLSSLPGEDALPLLPQVELMARALRGAVQQPDPIAAARLAIERTAKGLAELSDSLSRAYFSHLQTTSTLHSDWAMGL